MDSFIKFRETNLSKILILSIIANFSIGIFYLFYQGSSESLAATTISTNISTDGTLSIGGSATTSGSLYIANDLTILSGNVGIGTTSPDALLDIGKTAASHNDLFMISSSTAGDLLTIDRSGNVTAVAFIGDGSGLTNLPSGGTWTESGDDAYRETGNVGIGTTTPTELLTLSGGNFRQIPVTPVLKGSLGIGGTPYSVYVSGRYAYVVDYLDDDLRVIDVSDPTNPTLMGSMSLGANPYAVYVSGRYAYIVGYGSDDLKVIDVSDPTNPTLAGSVSVTADPYSVYVSGRYAYVVSPGSLEVIDISDPTNPRMEGSLGVGTQPTSIFVSGRYAYTVDYNDGYLRIIDISESTNPTLVGDVRLGVSDNCRSIYVSGRYAYVVGDRYDKLDIIDISDPDNPSIEASLAIGSYPLAVFVSGRYAYVTDGGSDDLKVIDVSDPTSPNLAGSLGIGGSPYSIYVSGKYAYVVDINSEDLKVIDVSGVETASMMAHSLEAGNLQVRNDIIAQGQLQITGGATVGTGGILTSGHIGIYASSSAPALKAVQHLTGDIFNLFDGSTEVFTVLDGGNVGIGTTTPGATLDIDNGTATTTIEVGDALTGGKGACFKLRDSDDAGWTYCSALDGSFNCSTDSCE